MLITLEIWLNSYNGLKDGEWKFYNHDETLVNVKSFEKGKPKGLFKRYWKNDGLTMESRAYYLNSHKGIYGFKGENGLYNVVSGGLDAHQYSGPKSVQYIKKVYILTEYGDIYKYKNANLKIEIQKNYWKYKRIIKRKFLKKLCPDKKLSIKDVYFENR